VAFPQRKQMSALSAISVPQCRQVIRDFSYITLNLPQ
jgi:hypothetical protein